MRDRCLTQVRIDTKEKDIDFRVGDDSYQEERKEIDKQIEKFKDCGDIDLEQQIVINFFIDHLKQNDEFFKSQDKLEGKTE